MYVRLEDEQRATRTGKVEGSRPATYTGPDIMPISISQDGKICDSWCVGQSTQWGTTLAMTHP